MMNALQKQKSKRHGTAVKRGIKQAKARKAIVKRAAQALRKAPKHVIVQRLWAKPNERVVKSQDRQIRHLKPT